MATLDLKEAEAGLTILLDKIFTDYTEDVSKVYQNLCKLYNRSTVELSLDLIVEQSTRQPQVEEVGLTTPPTPLLKVKLDCNTLTFEEGDAFHTEEPLVVGGFLRRPVGSLLAYFCEYFLYLYQDSLTKLSATQEVLAKINNLIQLLVVSYATRLQTYIKDL